MAAPQSRSSTTSPKTTGVRPRARAQGHRLDGEGRRPAGGGDQGARRGDREGEGAGGGEGGDDPPVQVAGGRLGRADAGEAVRRHRTPVEAGGRGGDVAERAAAVADDEAGGAAPACPGRPRRSSLEGAGDLAGQPPEDGGPGGRGPPLVGDQAAAQLDQDDRGRAARSDAGASSLQARAGRRRGRGSRLRRPGWPPGGPPPPLRRRGCRLTWTLAPASMVAQAGTPSRRRVRSAASTSRVAGFQ